MARIVYEDFDLVIQGLGPEGYQARVHRSPVGQAKSRFQSPFSDGEVEALLAECRGAGSLCATRQSHPAKALGQRLFAAAFSGAVEGCLQRSLAAVASQGHGLRIRLNLSEAAELAALPWEFLYNPSMASFLGRSISTPIVRCLDLSEGVRTTAVTPPLRLVVMISSPRDYPRLDVEREWSRLCNAVKTLEERGVVALERLESANLSALQQRLRQQECHILHFIGHGNFDSQSHDGTLVMEDEKGNGRPVNAEHLGGLLRDQRSVSLVVLNACEGACASGLDVFSGLAQGLVRCGIPAVIAMQFQISDPAAITFAREFYASIADGYPVDAAVTESRKAIFNEGNSLEWATPVLFMRSPDGQIFDVQEVSDEARKEVKIAALFRDARLLAAKEDWSHSIEKLQQLLVTEAGHVEARQLLDKCKRRREISKLFAAGKEHYDKGRWAEAVDCLTRAQTNGAKHEDVSDMLQRARAELAKINPITQRPAGGSTTADLDTHCNMIIKALMDGRVVPFLGKSANLCGRPPDAKWGSGWYAPTGDEVAEHLAANFGYPANEQKDLLRVSQYVSVTTGSGPLYDELHSLFDTDYKPTPLHEFFATVPTLLRAKGSVRPYQLIVTSNYDDVLERAFEDAGQPFDLVCYVAEGENRGKFLHRPPGGEYQVIERENEFRGVSLDERSVILKIHGAIYRGNPDQDSYVITEDHNIDYLTRTNVSSPVPTVLQAKLKKSQFLFFGSSLRDWNLRVFLHRVWGEQKLTYKSWAVQLNPQGVDRDFWRKREVGILDVCSAEHIGSLREKLLAMPLSAGA